MRKLDVLLAAGLAAVMVAEVWLEHLEPQAPSAALMALGGASLAWRRVYPLLVVLAIGCVSVAQAAMGMSMHSAVAPIVAVLIVSWSVGVYEERPRAILGLILLVCGVWVSIGTDVLRGTDHYQDTDVPWIGTLVLLPGLLGMAFSVRGRRLREAESRAGRLERERARAAAEERARIARELHDVIAHSVSVMTVQAGAAEEMLKVDADLALGPVRAVQEAGREALVEMQRLVGVLREDDGDALRDPQPGLRDLGRLIDQVRAAGIEVDCEIAGAERPLPIGTDLSAYRVVQEALTNTLKHGGGAAAHVRLEYGERDLSIDVTDDGAAASPPTGEGGRGLVGMRERIAIFGGTFAAGPREEGGFSVHVRLPLEGSP